jgi:hypothetical protein
MVDGKEQEVTALFTVFRDEREVTICTTESGTIVVCTKSWLRENNRELVQTVNAYTVETFAMMFEAMCLGAEYLGVDVKAEAAKLHASDDTICYEYAGRGEPNFSST